MCRVSGAPVIEDGSKAGVWSGLESYYDKFMANLMADAKRVATISLRNKSMVYIMKPPNVVVYKNQTLQATWCHCLLGAV